MTKFEDYLKGLNEFAKENPEVMKMDVITSKDDEGNGYNHVYYTPSKGNYNGDSFDSESDSPNSVCVN